MRHFLNLLFLLLILSSPALAGNGSANVSSVVSVGATSFTPNGMATVPLSCVVAGTCFSISCGPGASRTADHVLPCRKDGDLYQVTSGHPAHCFAITLWAATAADKYQLMSDTVTFANDAAVGTLTAPKYQNGVSGAYGIISHQTTSSIPDPYSGTYTFGSATWPGVQTSASDFFNITMMCQEQ